MCASELPIPQNGTRPTGELEAPEDNATSSRSAGVRCSPRGPFVPSPRVKVTRAILIVRERRDCRFRRRSGRTPRSRQYAEAQILKTDVLTSSSGTTLTAGTSIEADGIESGSGPGETASTIW